MGKMPRVGGSWWLKTCYSEHLGLFSGHSCLRSQTGVWPDNPCGPVAFALAVQNLVKVVHTVCDWQAWYLDASMLWATHVNWKKWCD